MIEYLDWDSHLFEFKTGSIKSTPDNNLIKLLLNAKEYDFKLIYYFSDNDDYVPDEILTMFNGKLVDRKVVYEKALNSVDIDYFGDSINYKSTVIDQQMLQLAYISGEYSRFKLDLNFSPNIFQKLYYEWLHNSLNGKIADEVYVVMINNMPVSFVTLKIECDIGKIGLIATSPKYQGRGYGKQLINRIFKTCFERNLSHVYVPTQLLNRNACFFYESCGFSVSSLTNIYHFWL